MVFKAVLFFVLLGAAYPSSDRLIPTSDGQKFHQCLKPLIVVFDPRLPKDDKEIAIESFQYWNDVIGSDIFVIIEDVSGLLPPEGYIVVRPLLPADGAPASACAVTTFAAEDGTGCAQYTQIVVTRLCGVGDLNMKRTILRHEIGHVLGLAHNDMPGDLMQPVVPDKGHPMHATPDEVKLMREMYGD